MSKHVASVFARSQSSEPYDTICDGCRTTCEGCSFDDPLLVPICTDVMDHAASPGGTVTLEMISIDGGYWRATPSSREVLRCYNQDACLGGVTGTPDYCLQGYMGPCELSARMLLHY